jgi:hypothetical protein
MFAAVLATALLAPGDLGHLFRPHRDERPAVGCCDDCGVETTRVRSLLVRLATCPRWRDRDNAAHALRNVEWECHPEVPRALVRALLCDPEEEVREEAAESLAKLKPCLPEVHAALDRASRCDPDHATRKWARRGLNNLGDECVDACTLCGTESEGAVLLPAGRSRVEPPIVVEPPLLFEPGDAVPDAPPVEVLPPSEMPPVPTGASPFGAVRSAARPPSPSLPTILRGGRVRAG